MLWDPQQIMRQSPRSQVRESIFRAIGHHDVPFPYFYVSVTSLNDQLEFALRQIAFPVGFRWRPSPYGIRLARFRWRRQSNGPASSHWTLGSCTDLFETEIHQRDLLWKPLRRRVCLIDWHDPCWWLLAYFPGYFLKNSGRRVDLIFRFPLYRLYQLRSQ